MSKNKYSNKKYRHNRELIIYKYGYKCANCNIKTSNIEVHHKNKNIDDNNINNLIPLCKQCHILIHKCF